MVLMWILVGMDVEAEAWKRLIFVEAEAEALWRKTLEAEAISEAFDFFEKPESETFFIKHGASASSKEH